MLDNVFDHTKQTWSHVTSGNSTLAEKAEVGAEVLAVAALASRQLLRLGLTGKLSETVALAPADCAQPLVALVKNESRTAGSAAFSELQMTHIFGTVPEKAAALPEKALALPDAAGYAGKYEPFHDTYMDWWKAPLEERHGAIAHLDKAPESINDYMRHKIIQYSMVADHHGLETVPAIKLIGTSRIPMGEQVADQIYNFGFGANRPDAHTLKVLTGIVPKLHPEAQGKAVLSLLNISDLPYQLEQAFKAPLTEQGVTAEVDGLLARTSTNSGVHQYTQLVADLPVAARRQIWDQAFGFSKLQEEMSGLPQQLRLQRWNEVAEAIPGELSKNETGLKLARYWADGLKHGDPLVKKAFEGFPIEPQRPPDLVRREITPTQFEWYGKPKPDFPPQAGQATSWSEADLQGTASQRLSRRALAGTTPSEALGQIEAISSNPTATPTQITGKIENLFPEIKLADNESALERLRSNPDFKQMSPADQTDLTLAVALTDASLPKIASQPGLAGNIAHGALASLDVDPVRAQRIAGLINGQEIGLSAFGKKPPMPWGTTPVMDLAAMTRAPWQGKKLETMLMALHPNSGEVGRLISAVNENAAVLSQDAVPVLTTQVPKGYGAVMLKGDFSFLSHVSPSDIHSCLESGRGVGEHLVSVLPKMESPDSPVSMALISPDNKKVYMFHDKPSIAAIFSASPENISQVSSQDLWSHTWHEGSWAQHLQDMETAATGGKTSPLLPDIITGKTLSTRELKIAWEDLTGFNSYDEAVAASGESINNATTINNALTAHIDYASGHTEVKAVDATLSGFIVQRRGLNVAFDGMSQQESLNLFGGTRPTWLKESANYWDSYSKTLKVPKAVWQEAQKRNIPFVFVE